VGWGWGFGVVGLGPQPQTPNPQSPIPNPQSPKVYLFYNIKILLNLKYIILIRNKNSKLYILKSNRKIKFMDILSFTNYSLF